MDFKSFFYGVAVAFFLSSFLVVHLQIVGLENSVAAFCGNKGYHLMDYNVVGDHVFIECSGKNNFVVINDNFIIEHET